MAFCCIIKKNGLGKFKKRELIKILREEVLNILDCQKAFLHIPSTVEDKHTNDGVSEHHIIEFFLDDLSSLEKGIHHIRSKLYSMGSYSEPIIQILLTREYEYKNNPIDEEKKFSYFVEYTGITNNDTAWCNHYIKNHVELMKKLPNIKQIVVHTPLAWIYPEGTHIFRSLLCNRVSFQTKRDFESALKSSVRDEMREDYKKFPRFDGICTHYAMETYSIMAES